MESACAYHIVGVVKVDRVATCINVRRQSVREIPAEQGGEEGVLTPSA